MIRQCLDLFWKAADIAAAYVSLANAAVCLIPRWLHGQIQYNVKFCKSEQLINETSTIIIVNMLWVYCVCVCVCACVYVYVCV